MVRVLEDTGLVRAVHKVIIHAPRLAWCGRHGNVVLSSILEELLSALELGGEFGHSPGCNDLEVGVACLEGLQIYC